jgi:quercetin dioxygenase-like cupin family protein
MYRLPILLLLLAASGCSDEPAAPAASVPHTPQFTAASGVTFDPLINHNATFDIDKVKRITGNWEVELEAKGGLDIAVRSFIYEPGSFTGWHRHPGPVFIQVLEGTVTFYEADDPDCNPIVVPAGQSYLDLGEHAHIGRNEGTVRAKDLVVLFAPPGTSFPTGFRNDAPAPPPGQCPFEN